MMMISEELTVVLEAGYDCGGNHYWLLQRINDDPVPYSLSDSQEDYGVLLNRFGTQGWELIRVIPHLDNDRDEMSRTAQFRRFQSNNLQRWEYTVVLLYVSSPEAASNRTAQVDVADKQLLAAARTHISGDGWQVVEAIDYAWASHTLEVIFKRRQAAAQPFALSRERD